MSISLVGNSFESSGVALIARLVCEPMISNTISETEAISGKVSPYGIRNAEKKYSSIAALVESDPIRKLVDEHGSPGARLYRAIYFDKTPERNWYVTWHQDKTIAVDQRFDAPGWGPWSVKDGAHHVQPPIDILNQMVTLRIHLDDTDEANGCLLAIPGSHHRGILTADEIEKVVAAGPVVTCRARAGDVLLMRPLTLHASRRASHPSHRRIIHLEFGPADLPSGKS